MSTGVVHAYLMAGVINRVHKTSLGLKVQNIIIFTIVKKMLYSLQLVKQILNPSIH